MKSTAEPSSADAASLRSVAEAHQKAVVENSLKAASKAILLR
jgi:hypothetical protein